MIEHGPKAGSKWFKFAAWFVDNLNFVRGSTTGRIFPNLRISCTTGSTLTGCGLGNKMTASAAIRYAG